MAALKYKPIGLAKLQAKLSRLPHVADVALEKRLEVEVDDMVDADKRAAPYDDGNESHEHIRDSIHAYRNTERAISFRIIVDAKGTNGEFIGNHVEDGHRAVNGEHVPARPFFWPTYRARKKGMKKRILDAARSAIRESFKGQGQPYGGS